MSEIWTNILKVLIFSVGAFVSLFVIAKLLGKKQIAELDFIDYAVGISLGSIASEWATGLDEPWYHFLIAMVVFFLLDVLVTVLSRKSLLFKKYLQGMPIVLIFDGKFNYKNLKSSKMSVNDVLGLCRAQGYFHLEEIAYAIFETNGEVSVMPKEKYRPATLQDLPNNKEIKTAAFPYYLVIDGKICDEQLRDVNQDAEWLTTKLQLDEKPIDNILLACYNVENDTFDIHYKDKNVDIPKIK
ncbi:MAG: DUF421 domain-containing protein [Clostridia bacterium]